MASSKYSLRPAGMHDEQQALLATSEVIFLELTLGQVVFSKAGRDTGRKFVIVGIADDEHVLIADGDLRKIENPKKKKFKHLSFEDNVIQQLNEKLIENQKISNAELRKILEI